jgi:DNA-binding CsgD family transcriptional regulator
VRTPPCPSPSARGPADKLDGVSARTRVYVAAVAGDDRRRLLADAARAGWIVVDRPGDADLVLGPAGRWPAGGSGVPAPPRYDDQPVEALTAREREVLVLLADGVGNREIASRLGISEHTVKFHLSAVFGKLGASTRTEAVRRALRYGLIDL